MSGRLSALRLGTSWLRRALLEPELPLTAVEVRPRNLGVVRLVRERGRLRLGAAASVDLPEGVLKLAMTEPNVLEPESLRRALESLLERAGARGESRIGLVLPDPVVRVALLPLTELGAVRRRDLDETARFRLRKVLPFEAREARVATLLPRGGAASTAVVAAVFRPVLEGYESALASLGLHPGLVEVACLALTALGGDAPVDRLLVNWDHGYVSLVLTRAGWPVLLRTLAGEYVTRPELVAREVANTVLYYRERLGGSGLAGALVRSAALDTQEAVALLAEPLGFAPEVLDPWAPLGIEHGDMAAQAVAGAAACVLRRAA